MTRCIGVLVLPLALAACAGAHATAPPVMPDRGIHIARPATRWVSTHGIEVAVPARWRLGRGVCGTPKANTVLWNEDGILTCLTGQPPGLSVVEFGGIVHQRRGWYRRHTTLVTIDGARARRRDVGRTDGSREVQLVFPSRGIAVTVLSPSRSLLRRLLAFVRMTRVDENGCPTRPAPVFRRGSRPNSSQPLVPKGAVRVVGCSYKGLWLDRSNRVGRPKARRLERALDAAPYGFSHSHAGSFLPSACEPSWRASLVIVRFEYAGGRPPVSVAAHLSGCSRLGASNGRWAVRLRPGWVGGIMRDANYAGDYQPYGR